MHLDKLPRVKLAALPTPLHEAPRLSAMLGIHLYIKRDDLTGLAMGGNKTRKLEFLVGEALQQGADTLVTAGPPQSNHTRQTAAAAARYGLRCILVLRGHPVAERTGNLLLNALLGAEVRWSGDRAREEVMDEVAEAENQAGHRPYAFPVGGSNAVGATGYVAAVEELVGQLHEQRIRADRVVFATSSGGTHAGIIVGAKAAGYRGQMLGIAIDASVSEMKSILRPLVEATAARVGWGGSFDDRDFVINADYLGAGYGVLNEAERETLRLVARQEGLLLDPVYTVRAFTGMIDLVRRGEIGQNETVVFWHTGGLPALFAYGESLNP